MKIRFLFYSFITISQSLKRDVWKEDIILSPAITIECKKLIKIQKDNTFLNQLWHKIKIVGVRFILEFNLPFIDRKRNYNKERLTLTFCFFYDLSDLPSAIFSG